MSCVSCCAADTLDMQFIDNIRGGLVQNNAARSFQTFKKNQNRKRSGLGEIVLIEPCGLFAVSRIVGIQTRITRIRSDIRASDFGLLHFDKHMLDL